MYALSDTFDTNNNNCGLEVYPMGLYRHYGREMKDRMVSVALWLHKPCQVVDGFEFECIVTSDCNNETKSIEGAYPSDINDCDCVLFKSTELWNIESLTINVKLNIAKIDGNDSFFE